MNEMTKTDVINKVKILQSIKDEKDEILSILYDLVIDELYELLNEKMLELNLESLLIKMLNYKYLRLGTESLSSYNYSGVSENFLSEYPSDIQNTLNEFRKKTRKAIFI